ncbi:MAG: energy transducer TonB [Candidatus Solibacter sp.]|nr:energy transducer TonB [Candidatus Solibacter sp.]
MHRSCLFMAILLWPLLAFSQTLNRQQAAAILQRSEFFSQTENVRLVLNIDLLTRSERTLELYGALEYAGIVTIRRERYAMGPVAYAGLTPRGQSMCGQPQSEFRAMSVVDCVVARREVLAVTGVASQGRQAEVEGYWWMRPFGIGLYLPVGAPYGGARSTDVLRPWSSIFRTNFTMRLWDDGWRVSAPEILPMIVGGDSPLNLEQLPAEVRQRMQSSPPLGFAPPPSPPAPPAPVPTAPAPAPQKGGPPAASPAQPPPPPPPAAAPSLPFGIIGGIIGGTTAPAAGNTPPLGPQPRLISKVAPAYPPLAKQAGVQGSVTLSASVDETGSVDKVTVIRGHPLLVPAAIDAVKQWRFAPATVNGQPVRSTARVEVEYEQ